MTAPAQAVPRASAARTSGTALFLLTTLNLFNFIDRYILPGVQPLVQKEFHVNDAQIGLLTTAFFFTYMLAAFPAGLVIYWAWNNLLSIAQQWTIMHRAGAA